MKLNRTAAYVFFAEILARVGKTLFKATLCCAAIGLAACEDGGGGCKVERLGPLQVLNRKGVPIVKVTINGKPAAMIVDTGAGMSGVSSSIHAFDVAYTGATTLGYGIGGLSRFPIMSIAELGMGTAIARNVQMIQTDQKFGFIGGVPIVGLFGADFLSNYTVALELPHLTVSLYRLHECADEKERWEKEFDPVPFSIDNDRHVEISIKLNGASVDAILDSGAVGTTILPDDAARAGVTKSMLQTDRTASLIGVDQNVVRSWRHKFRTLQVGKEVFRDPSLLVAPLEISTSLLGADFLRHNSVMISYPYRRLYIRNDDAPADGASPR
ncbi:hypothetical protein AA23498_3364 [Acetobacter nitrogenifigens DSM 23921 = NBRC 105050]|uniref:Peptidase A2 domain-containing protein n=1 Tax=Acetobacter nitrogenifigens DSM 23921 = NBRC 105050 TaxID=1120919 RepID=A0A511X6N5_9PROT|nr:retroviral-like aspartic protease family protein [Acetobacter nitrogenifigens]GBQ98942.1 hypothetical protein AA23498_3364 [Acetobacter nitrogenifigens DSM 23921 = NBRC 105050]GEN58600.1 hypothetical protein ANI02nite_04840 [Acetobacter nitrogenifigens DSM 23921 = NBRC 105050]